MVLKLMKITESLLEDKKVFVSEYVLDTNIPQNKEYTAAMLQIVTQDRPEVAQVGRRYELSIVPQTKKNKV